MRLLAVDPGPDNCHWVLVDTNCNLEIMEVGYDAEIDFFFPANSDVMVIEQITSPGGQKIRKKPLFETTFTSGRIYERWRQTRHQDPKSLTRTQVKRVLGGVQNDTEVKNFVRAQYTEKNYCRSKGVKYDVWQALGLAWAYAINRNLVTVLHA